MGKDSSEEHMTRSSWRRLLDRCGVGQAREQLCAQCLARKGAGELGVFFIVFIST